HLDVGVAEGDQAAGVGGDGAVAEADGGDAGLGVIWPELGGVADQGTAPARDTFGGKRIGVCFGADPAEAAGALATRTSNGRQRIGNTRAPIERVAHEPNAASAPSTGPVLLPNVA